LPPSSGIPSISVLPSLFCKPFWVAPDPAVPGPRSSFPSRGFPAPRPFLQKGGGPRCCGQGWGPRPTREGGNRAGPPHFPIPPPHPPPFSLLPVYPINLLPVFLFILIFFSLPPPPPPVRYVTFPRIGVEGPISIFPSCLGLWAIGSPMVAPPRPLAGPLFNSIGKSQPDFNFLQFHMGNYGAPSQPRSGREIVPNRNSSGTWLEGKGFHPLPAVSHVPK